MPINDTSGCFPSALLEIRKPAGNKFSFFQLYSRQETQELHNRGHSIIMKQFAFIFIFAVACLSNSLAFARTQAGPSAPATNATVATDNNGASSEKQDMAGSHPAKKAQKHAKHESKSMETNRPLTPEEQAWEKAVYNQ